ncbi:uncharacterized protein F4812DRAFT_408747 [Daldinia caldariorum]|uniref:uncharacterized protein n=1 Tax=Daldinia caldariorum TaxID=326644 RepID=UPI00200856EF|nr:uncharacterized protein F4812DRAFT_408747 [Daldinia caldariorum]KAI1472398.1 hypothetical protein F4812DRAFT_408747 [Daldinia caldariorum]
MLLTSSQVSVVLSSGIVILCTAALFLSGYVIQQRTLRDLRAAIKPTRIPRPSPKVYHPDHLSSPSHLEDTISDSRLPHRRRQYSAEEGGGGGGGGEDVVIVRPTVSDGKLEQKQPAMPERDDATAGAQVGTPNDVEEPSEENKKKKKSEEKPISRAERRRKIKEEIRQLSEGQERVYYQRRLW